MRGRRLAGRAGRRQARAQGIQIGRGLHQGRAQGIEFLALAVHQIAQFAQGVFLEGKSGFDFNQSGIVGHG